MAMPDYVFRIILIGDSSTGKSCFLNKLSSDVFNPNCSNTVGVDFKTAFINLNDSKICKFQIWDTAGQEQFYSICKSYYKYTAATFLFYDISKRNTFLNIPSWIEKIKENNENYNKDGSSIIYLIGNKNDLEDREISTEEGEKLAKEYNLLFSEVTCKSGDSVIKSTEILGNEIYNRIKDGKISLTDTSSGVKTTDISHYINIKETESKNTYCCAMF